MSSQRWNQLAKEKNIDIHAKNPFKKGRLKPRNNKFNPFSDRSTSETYQLISSLGLRTVEWETYNEINNSSLSGIETFIQDLKPCLFIYDPKTPDLKKDYLFNVTDFKEVEIWLENNSSNLKDYSYLITTQVDGYSESYVGLVFSNGKDKLKCEILQKPYLSNTRKLTQPEEDIRPYLNHFICEADDENFELVAIEKSFPYSEIQKIMNAFQNKKGLFEISKGVHLGKHGIFTMGFEQLEYPLVEHNSIYTPKNKMLANIIEYSQ